MSLLYEKVVQETSTSARPLPPFPVLRAGHTCHGKGAEAGEVTPLIKTQEQWKRYFDKGTHSKGTQKLSDVVPAEQLIDIQTFLVNHAADSPQPETCG